MVGDIHGQYYDLVHLLDKVGNVAKYNFIFLGDYVDRGLFSFEVIMLLFSLKLNYPKSIIMLRGNHESTNMTTHFTFRKEILEKFDEDLYEELMKCFCNLPLSCLANK